MKQCKCSLRHRVVGDGCDVCNPELARELSQEVSMEKDEVEEIRKRWINPETGRAWDVFASSSEALFTAKLDIPDLIKALEVAQIERDQANEVIKNLLDEKKEASQREAVFTYDFLMQEARLHHTKEVEEMIRGAFPHIEQQRKALARTEKEGGG